MTVMIEIEYIKIILNMHHKNNQVTVQRKKERKKGLQGPPLINPDIHVKV